MTIEFFYELGSPYSYLASTQIDDLAQRHGAEVVWKPVVLGAVFKATGNVMNASIPAKAQHMYKDLLRWAKQYQVPLTMPAVFPINTIAPHRVILAVAKLHGDDAGREMARALFETYWVQGEDISDPEVLGRVVTQAGLEVGAILEGTQDPEVKATLRSYTDDAIERGVFGAPTFFVGDKMFWGNDRLHHLEHALS